MNKLIYLLLTVILLATVVAGSFMYFLGWTGGKFYLYPFLLLAFAIAFKKLLTFTHPQQTLRFDQLVNRQYHGNLRFALILLAVVCAVVAIVLIAIRH